jgi:hypothetical protein
MNNIWSMRLNRISGVHVIVLAWSIRILGQFAVYCISPTLWLSFCCTHLFCHHSSLLCWLHQELGLISRLPLCPKKYVAVIHFNTILECVRFDPDGQNRKLVSTAPIWVPPDKRIEGVKSSMELRANIRSYGGI